MRHSRFPWLIVLAACGTPKPQPDDSDVAVDTDDAEDTDTVDADTSTDASNDTDVPVDEDTDLAGYGANLLRGESSGGTARVVEITGYDAEGETPVSVAYNTDLDAGCALAWHPQGTLCDEAPGTDSPLVSTRPISGTGATWRTSYGVAPITGVLVVDACTADACTDVTFDEARVFQMFSDGKTTDLRISVHASTSSSPPAWNDEGWVTVSAFERIGGGLVDSRDVTIVRDPTILSFAEQTTRYVRLEAQNDGTHGDPSYIELRSVKLFDRP